MADTLTKTELLARIDASWQRLIDYVDSLQDDQRTQMVDPEHWTVKDHAIHLSVWEDSQAAALDREDRPTAMGVPPSSWGDWDAVNAILQSRNRDRTWDDVRDAMHTSHARLIAHIRALSEAQLLLPYNHFQPASPWDVRVIDWLSGNTWDHYQEHQAYMEAIVRGDEDEHPPTVTELLRRIECGWDKLWAYLGTLTPDQLTQKTDAGGWTIKDHVIHLAMWEYGVMALLDGKSQLEAMGVGEATWEIGFDALNALIQERNREMSLEQVYTTFRSLHAQTVERIAQLSDEDLQRPTRYFQPASDQEHPILGWLVADTYRHYIEHLPWIKAIAKG